MSTAQDARRLVATRLAVQLAQDATEAARDAEAGTPAWRFYHGVEAAAQQVVHPEVAAVREGTTWLDREDPSFRAGFLEASTALATTVNLPDPPLRVRLPHPPV
jgi:hypothetical protein